MPRIQLSNVERLEIDRRAARMKNPKPGPIAKAIGRNFATVSWYMLTHGMILPKAIIYNRPIVIRHGKEIVPYSEDEDARIWSLRVAGKTPNGIAAIVLKETGVKRTGHSIYVRLTMLAAYRGDAAVGTIEASG